MTPNKSPRRWNLDNCGRGPSAKHSTTPAADLIESPRGLAYESLTRRCVIIDPLHPHPPSPTGGLADRWRRRQEVSDWVTLNKHWQLPDGWIWPTSVPHISAARDPQLVSQHLAPGSLFCVSLLLSLFFFPSSCCSSLASRLVYLLALTVALYH